jgi:hypothetical protein
MSSLIPSKKEVEKWVRNQYADIPIFKEVNVAYQCEDYSLCEIIKADESILGCIVYTSSSEWTAKFLQPPN